MGWAAQRTQKLPPIEGAIRGINYVSTPWYLVRVGGCKVEGGAMLRLKSRRHVRTKSWFVLRILLAQGKLKLISSGANMRINPAIAAATASYGGLLSSVKTDNSGACCVSKEGQLALGDTAFLRRRDPRARRNSNGNPWSLRLHEVGFHLGSSHHEGTNCAKYALRRNLQTIINFDREHQSTQERDCLNRMVWFLPRRISIKSMEQSRSPRRWPCYW